MVHQPGLFTGEEGPKKEGPKVEPVKQSPEVKSNSDRITSLIGKLFSKCVGQLTGRGKSAEGKFQESIELNNAKYAITVQVFPYGEGEIALPKNSLIEHIDGDALADTLKDRSPLTGAFSSVAQKIADNPDNSPIFRVKINSEFYNFRSADSRTDHIIFIQVQKKQQKEQRVVGVPTPTPNKETDDFLKRAWWNND